MLLQFKCSCIACKKNYPTAEHLKRAGGLRCTLIVAHALRNIAVLDPMIARAAYRTLIDFLQRNDSNSPCTEIASCQQLYINVMAGLYNTMHLHSRVSQMDPESVLVTHSDSDSDSDMSLN